jgi:MoaA/NifB/PqqE/SkfB family radical SAM enzyme
MTILYSGGSMKKNTSPYSNLKIFAHPKKLKSIQDGIITAPIYIRIKPTNSCNQNCSYCHYGSGQYLELEGQNQRNHIPWEKLNEILDDLGDMGVKAVTFSGGGEPLVYPKIIEAMKKVTDNKIDLSIITNGQLLKGEKAETLLDAKWVRVSMDAATAENYSRIRSVKPESFIEVCKNIKGFTSKKRKNCEFGINFVVTRENADEVFNAGELVHSLGVNHIKYTAVMSNNVNEYHKGIKEKVITQIEEVRSKYESESFNIINLYKDDFELCAVFERTYERCYLSEIVTVIAADSKVYFCHDKAYLKDGVVGDLSDKSFKELWFSDETRDRLNNLNAKNMCKHHCVYDNRNLLLNAYMSQRQEHINFI